MSATCFRCGLFTECVCERCPRCRMIRVAVCKGCVRETGGAAKEWMRMSHIARCERLPKAQVDT